MTKRFSRTTTKAMTAVLATASFASINATANDLFLDVNPDAFFARFDGTHSSNGFNLSASALITDENGDLYSLGLFKSGTVQNNSNLQAALGLKISFIDGENDNAQALSLGGSIGYKLPQAPQVTVSAEVYYAPSITISDDLDGLLDFTAKVSYQLFENGSIYGGYRLVEIDVEDARDFEIDENLFFGIQLTF